MWRTGIILLISLSSLDSHAQDERDTLNVDEKFALARTYAFSGKREEARELCREVLAESPNYHDVRILIGRTFAWDHQYENAREELDKVLDAKPSYKDAINAALDVELWSDDPEAALRVANAGIKYHPTDEDILVKKAKALDKLERYKEAVIVLNKVLEINPTNEAALSLLERINFKMMRSGLGTRYQYQWFSDTTRFDPWHAAYVEGKRKTKLGSLIGRINYAHRFNRDGFQGEIDFYPKIRKGTYGYLNTGYSPTDLFPRYRFGAEMYQKLPWSMECSAGFRHLMFFTKTTENKDTAKNVTIYTGSIGKYWGNWWFSLRSYVTPKGIGASVSGVLFARRYFSDADNHLTLEAGTGFSPDQPESVNFNPELKVLNSRKAGVEWQFTHGHHIIYQTGFKYENQEYRSGNDTKFTDVYTAQLGVKFRF